MRMSTGRRVHPPGSIFGSCLVPSCCVTLGKSLHLSAQLLPFMYFIYYFYEVGSIPSVGLELRTPRSRVPCSAD